MKDLEEFPPAAKRADGRASYCRPCQSIRSRESYRRRAAAEGRVVQEKPAPLAPGWRRCPDCGAVQDVTAFPRNKNGKDGRGTYCKPCHNLRSRKTVERLYGSTRHYHLRRRYRISAEDVDAMIEAQGGLCPICQVRPPEHVDHDHDTGAVRGVLCFACNGGLGLFKDRVDIMRNAIDYLERTTWPRTSEG